MKSLLIIATTVCLSMNIHAQTVHTEGNKITVTQNGQSVTVSENAITEGTFQHNGKLYYIELGPSNKIVAYDIVAGSYTDIVTTGMQSEKGYEVKEIINIIPDAGAGKIYFTSKHIYKDYPIYLTWLYDITGKKISVFSDGQITGINSNGMLEILFKDTDSQGAYTQKVYYNSFRELVKMDDKSYQ